MTANTLNDIGNLICLLDRHKHWRIQCVNRFNGADRGSYECTVWGNGRRVSAYSVVSPAKAAARVLKKLANKSATKLKVVG